MVNFIGVNQSADWEQTMAVAKHHADKGRTVQIRRQDFLQASEEHDRYEYEVHVDLPMVVD